MSKEILIGQEPHNTLGKRKAGRPPGVSYRQQVWDRVVKPRFEGLVVKGLELAEEGDSIMLKFFLEKGLPKQVIETPLKIVDNALQQLTEIMHHAASGNLSSDDAVKLSTIVRERVNVGQVTQLAEKLTQFEEWIKNQGQGITINGDIQNGEKMDSGSNKE